MPWLMKSEKKAGGSPWFRSRYPKNLVFSELQSSTDVYRNLQDMALWPTFWYRRMFQWSRLDDLGTTRWNTRIEKKSGVNYRRNSGFLNIFLYDNILLIQRCMSLVLRSPEKFLHQSQTIHWFKELPLLFDSSIFGQTGPATKVNRLVHMLL